MTPVVYSPLSLLMHSVSPALCLVQGLNAWPVIFIETLLLQLHFNSFPMKSHHVGDGTIFSMLHHMTYDFIRDKMSVREGVKA